MLVVCAALAYRFYEGWEERHLSRQAEAYLAAGDLNSAGLTARRAIQSKTAKITGYRVLARIAETQGRATAADFREAAADAAPQSTEDLILLAQTALQFNRISLAESTLTKLQKIAGPTAAYHEGEAQLAVLKGDPISAEQHFVEAARLEPSNSTYQLNLAGFQLQSGSPESRAHAREVLRKFLDDKSTRVTAARALRDYLAQSKNLPALMEVASALYSYPEATFHDRLSYLQILHALSHPEFTRRLGELQSEAVTDPNKLTELLSWMNSNQLSVLAIHWIKELPREVVNRRPVPVAVADCYVAANDWIGLAQWCKQAEWHDMKFAMHAYLCRSLRERDDKLNADAQWALAVQEASSDGERMQSLAQTAAKWDWKTQAEELLWKLANDPQKQNEALAALYQHYFDKGDTGNLYRVAARVCKVRPDDDEAQNNLTQLALLLKLHGEHAADTAARLYQKDPRNPVFASTYGFSLYGKGRYQEAVAAMDQLSEAALHKSTIAAYYGVFLAAAGNSSKAAEYLRIGAEAPLLPEEKTLLQNAQEKIDGKEP